MKRYLSSGGSHSKGADLNHHSADISLSIKKKFDNRMKKQFPEVWKYIEHYASKE